MQISVSARPARFAGGSLPIGWGPKKICAVFLLLIFPGRARFAGKRDEVNLGAESLSWMGVWALTGKDGLRCTGWSGVHFLFRCVLNMCV